MHDVGHPIYDTASTNVMKEMEGIAQVCCRPCVTPSQGRTLMDAKSIRRRDGSTVVAKVRTVFVGDARSSCERS